MSEQDCPRPLIISWNEIRINFILISFELNLVPHEFELSLVSHEFEAINVDFATKANPDSDMNTSGLINIFTEYSGLFTEYSGLAKVSVTGRLLTKFWNKDNNKKQTNQ